MKIKNILSAALAVALLTGCGNEETMSYETVNVKPYNAVAQEQNDSLSYSGYVSPDSTGRLSFKLSGKIKDIYVKKGDTVKKGEKIAALDTADIQVSVDNADENINMAQNKISQATTAISDAEIGLRSQELTLEKLQLGIDTEKTNLKKIEDSYSTAISQLQLKFDNAEKNYKDMQILYNSGTCSQHDFDNAKLAYDTAKEELEGQKETRDNDIELENNKIKSLEDDYNLQLEKIASSKNTVEQAKQQKQSAEIALEQAKIAKGQSTNSMTDTVLLSSIDGYVAEIPMNEGEVVSAGTPVVVVVSNEKVINVSIPVEDYENFSVGMAADIEYNGENIKGSITSVELYPDESTRTYNIEVTPQDDSKFVLGSLVDVSFTLGSESYINVPLGCIFNTEGKDFVYSLEKNKEDTYILKAREIAIVKTNEENACITGIDSGTVIVADEVRKLHEGQEVKLISQ